MSLLSNMSREPTSALITERMSSSAAYVAYTHLPALQPVQDLPERQLTVYSNAMGTSEQMSHRLAAAWSSLELAQVVDGQERTGETTAHLDHAAEQVEQCAAWLRTSRYKDDKELAKRRYRTALTQLYLPHYRQNGLQHWPEQITEFQSTIYRKLHEIIVAPLLTEFTRFERSKDRFGSYQAEVYSGILGEMVVLQSINRLHIGRKTQDCAATPGSAREDCRDWGDRSVSSDAFDMKVTFPDRRFIPTEVKWNRKHDNPNIELNPKIARVYITDAGNVKQIAHTMGKEAARQVLSPFERNLLNGTTDLVLRAMENAGYSGVAVAA